MAALALRSEERIGLGLALAFHAALVAVLVWRPAGVPVVAPPERISVTLSEDVGLTSTSPESAAEAAPDTAPELGEQAPPAPSEAEPDPQPLPVPPRAAAAPQPRARPEPRPEPPRARPEPPRPAPRPVARPVPRPAAQPRPAPKAPAPKAPAPRPAAKAAPPSPIAARIAAASSRSSAARPAAKQAAAPARVSGATPGRTPPANAGGSRIGSDFLSGVPNAAAKGEARAAPAAAIGPAVRASLASAISRQLKPKWTAPQGADAELLVTVLAFDLNADGTLRGRPRVVRQEGINDANRPQASRHAEQAIRAVQLASPFDLPEQYYDAWKRVSSFRFDRRLSQ